MQLRTLSTGFIVGAAALLGAMGATVANATPATVAAPAVAGTTSVTLPLMGAPLTIDITTGPGGALTDVSVNPADGLTATMVKPNRVSFVNADGTAKVSVKSKGNGQSVSARAGSLADISGDGSWSGDVFGTGTNTDVAFNVSAAADGSPVIAVTSVSDPSAVPGDMQSSTHDDDMSARVSIAFTSAAGDQTRSLTIRAKVDNESDEHDGDQDGDQDSSESHASISVSLGRLHGVAQDAATAAGAKSWTGLLCDGVTMGVINYTLNADGTFTDVAATPTPESIKGHDHSVEVRFSHDERITISAKVRDGMVTVNVREGIRCSNAVDPTVNTPTSISPDHQDGHHDGHHDHEGGHHDGGGHGGHGGN